MQCRRRWTPQTLFAIVAALAASTSSSAYAALDLPKLSAELDAATDSSRAITIQNDVVSEVDAITSPVAKNARGKEVVANFEGLVASKNPLAALNAAIIIANMHTISTDAALIRMLGHANPPIRYWAAKGLGNIPNLKAVNGHKAAIIALQAQLAKETSGVVKKEIIRTIAKLGELADLITVLDVLAGAMQATLPDQETLEAANAALAEVERRTSTTPAATEAAAIAKHASAIASFASQHEVATRAKDPGLISDSYHAAVLALVNSAIKVLNNASGKSSFAGIPDGKAEEILVLVSGIVGSTTFGPGQVQKTFPGVPVPPAIKPAK